MEIQHRLLGCQQEFLHDQNQTVSRVMVYDRSRTHPCGGEVVMPSDAEVIPRAGS